MHIPTPEVKATAKNSYDKSIHLHMIQPVKIDHGHLFHIIPN